MRWHRLIYPGLALLTLLVYGRVVGYGFVNYDDTTYVTENRHVLRGLTGDSVIWAFTTDYFSNWHPLTWLSYMADVECFGRNAAGFHAHSIVLHTANVLLLFTVLWRTTGHVWRSVVVAALFAVHPLHVESVAWISERKDVLSTFFGLLAVGAYAAFARQGAARWYLAAMLAYTCSLLSKQTLVTLPFVLLLLDYWPLKRSASPMLADTSSAASDTTEARAPGSGRDDGLASPFRRLPWSRLVWEKLPFFALAAAFSVVVLIVQRRGGSMAALEHHSLFARAGNAVVAYVLYLGHMFWPAGLSVFYPHPGDAISPAAILSAAICLLLATAAAVAFRNRSPYLLVGWFWYLGTLVPMIGLIQIGQQRMADRYTYVPLLGLYIAVTWLVADLATSAEWRRRAAIVTAAVVIAALASRALSQAGYWRDSRTLFSRALETTQDNHVAHNSLGHAMKQRGLLNTAVRHYREAVRIAPWFVEAHTNLGSALYAQGRVAEAMQEFRRALELDPNEVESLNNLANALRDQGELDEAVDVFYKALQLDAEHPAVHTNLGIALYLQGRRDEALEHFRQAVRIDPDYAAGHFNLASALDELKEFDLARHHLEQAFRLDPDLKRARGAPQDGRSPTPAPPDK